MSATIRVTHTASGQSLLVRCDLSRAESPVEVHYLEGGDWSPTQYQAGNARHRTSGLAALGTELLIDALQLQPEDDQQCDWEPVALLNDGADTEHQEARDWYESYGWHLTTESAGDVTLQAVEYDWLDSSDDADVIARLLESDESLTADEAAEIVSRAREVRQAAESICSLLDDAVAAYEAVDGPAVVRCLKDAADAEWEHGDAPATQALSDALLTADLPRDVRAALLAG